MTLDFARRAMPLAARMRPRTLDEFVGQETLLGAGRPLRAAIERDAVPVDDPVGAAGERKDDACADRRARPRARTSKESRR